MKNIIRHMRIASCIPKATNTHSEYVILIAFRRLQWLRERAPMLHYTYCILCVLFEYGYVGRYDKLVKTLELRSTKSRARTMSQKETCSGESMISLLSHPHFDFQVVETLCSDVAHLSCELRTKQATVNEQRLDLNNQKLPIRRYKGPEIELRDEMANLDFIFAGKLCRKWKEFKKRNDWPTEQQISYFYSVK